MNTTRMSHRLPLALTLIAAMNSTVLANGDATAAAKPGVALELSLGTDAVPIGETATLGMVKGGLFLGYRTERVTIGLGLDVDRVSTSRSIPGDPADDDASTELVIMPGIRVTATRSADGRVESFVQADLGYGKIFVSEDGESDDDTSYSRITYQLGPGFRYWLHPQFAVGASAGLRGDIFNVSEDSEFDSYEYSTGVTAIYSSLQLTGVF